MCRSEKISEMIKNHTGSELRRATDQQWFADIALDRAYSEYLIGEFTLRDLAVVIWTLYNVDTGNPDEWGSVEEIEELIKGTA